MKKFEYKFIMGDKISIDRDVPILDELGKDSWELVAIMDIHKSGEWPGTKRPGYWLKRELKD